LCDAVFKVRESSGEIKEGYWKNQTRKSKAWSEMNQALMIIA